MHKPNDKLFQGAFMPFWLSQSLSALNDNLFRYALNAALIFGVIQLAPEDAKFYVSISAGIFILPYLIFSGLAGQLADKFSKTKMLRINRAIEIAVFSLAGFALYAGSMPLLLVCLLLSGIMATFYGPVKQGITPELVAREQLIAANGAVESGTYAAILIGTLLGTGIITHAGFGVLATVGLMLGIAVLALILSHMIPITTPAAPELKIEWNLPKQAYNLVRWGLQDATRQRLLLGNAWFWFVGAAVLSQLTILVKSELHATADVNTLLLALFAMGIGLGGFICHRLLHGQVNANYVPLAAFGMAIFALLFAVFVWQFPAAAAQYTFVTFLQQPAAYGMMLAVVLMAACAGLYVVPIVSLLQTSVPDGQRAQLLSLANIWFSLFVILSAAMSGAMIAAKLSASAVIATVGLLTLGVAFYALRLLPEAAMKGMFAALLRLFFKIEVKGLENLQAAGRRAVIVSNHQSFLDGIILATFLPGKPVFAVDTVVATRWWAKPFLSLVEVFTINPTQPLNTRQLIRTIQQDRHCVIFPEGRLTETGGLMKVNSGPAMIAEKADASIVPLVLSGLEYTPFSRAKAVLPVKWFPRITIQFMPPMKLPDTNHLSGKKRRLAQAQYLYDIMRDAQFNAAALPQNIWQGMMAAAHLHGGDKVIVEDHNRQPRNYRYLLSASLALGKVLARLTQKGERVGVLMPTGFAGLMIFLALQAYGRVTALLNYTSGITNNRAALQAAQVKTIITARAFIYKGKLQGLLDAITKPHPEELAIASVSKDAQTIGANDYPSRRASGAPQDEVRVIYLEDLKSEMNLPARLVAWWQYQQGFKCDSQPHDPAVVLFTSGSEGVPKGVVLSHHNLLANAAQAKTVVGFTPHDVVFNALPLFHAFGLTGGTLLPLLNGVRTFLYPNPLHYRIVPELVYQANATILFGTDTFLNGYAKTADPYDFYRVRMIFAGAEKVKPETQAKYAEKFGVPIYEGYGVTECSPVLAVNTPMHHQAGTVGRLLPGIDYRLEKITGIETGGKLHVRGPNMMLGYLKADRPGELQPLENNWYNTGDVVSVDDAGFATIQGRIKRFAKIGGEMISLAAIEVMAAQLWPDAQHAAINIPDARKGEAIILYTTQADAELPALITHMRAGGATELMIPKTLQILPELPVLGSGKIDYVALKNRIHH